MRIWDEKTYILLGKQKVLAAADGERNYSNVSKVIVDIYAKSVYNESNEGRILQRIPA